jgi:peptidoglycan/LPS O-acetylase OafA/YrhL
MDMMNPPVVGASRTGQSTRLAEIEVLRAIAVLMVLVDHVPINLLFWHSRLSDVIFHYTGLWTGVDLFFAISGFVIARTLLPRLAGVEDWAGFIQVAIPFWIARAWRLLPSAWFWLLVPLPLCLFFNRSQAYASLQANCSMLVAGVLDVANFHVAFSPVMGEKRLGTAFVQWSLSLEEQFYLLLPFAAFFFRRRLAVPLALVALAGFFVPNTAYFMLLRLWPVALGVLLAMWSVHPSYQDCAPSGLAKHRAARAGMLVILLLCLDSVGTVSLHIVDFYQGVVASISVVLVWLASYGRGYLWQEGWSRRVMEMIAARSYSLYLVHIPIYFAAHEIWYRRYDMVNPTQRQAAAMVVCAVVCVFAVAELNHRLLEKPLREHGKRLAAAYRARATLQPAEA